ncbi:MULTISPECIES: XRE family transcriptional regulator [unclassified Brevibacterium]|uniref:XRE family transcriptional regulator n=1 Tax=unclassified Brevibacterium TaxID=2614124 RepID=UPI001E551801|nr:MULTISPECIES: XRE family transcriptional regulator [unclassified Brevibacterium]MCD1286034.1 XRE family transcriptional regulator [Brevibacterium sp. CCUG 69071]MDK8433385.1 helix-turn-helix domain-containing protein [Brevibacterium sp. H-BE7]
MGRFRTHNPGALIREARLDFDISQAELARRADLAESVIAEMESGVLSVDPDMLERVLQAADYRPNVALKRCYAEIRQEAARRDLRNVRIFGSVALGDDGFDSDIDLLVTPGKGTTAFDIANFVDCVRQITGFPADVIVDTKPFPPGWTAAEEAVPL